MHYYIYSVGGKDPSLVREGSMGAACAHRYGGMSRKEAERLIYRFANSDNGASIAPNIIVVTKEGGWRILLPYEEFFRRDTELRIRDIKSGRRCPDYAEELGELEELQRQGR